MQDYTDTEICVRDATSLLRDYVFIYAGVVNSGFCVQVKYKPDSNVAAVMFTSRLRTTYSLLRKAPCSVTTPPRLTGVVSFFVSV